MRLRPLLGALCAASAWLLAMTAVSAELLGVALVSRHGSRAPNAVSWTVCPENGANRELYRHMGVLAAGLTSTGEAEMVQLGEFIRRRYRQQTQLIVDPEQLFVQASDSERTRDSAELLLDRLFPEGWRRDLNPRVRWTTLQEDNLLEPRQAGCRRRLQRDTRRWDQEFGLAALQTKEGERQLQWLRETCGPGWRIGHSWTNPANNGSVDLISALKEVTDMLTFDFTEDMPLVGGMGPRELLELRAFNSIFLEGRLFSTEAQITYMNGELPQTLVQNFASIANREGAANVFSYHSHRQTVYALAHFLGIGLDIDYPAIPRGAIPTSTTIFLELHSTASVAAEADVETGQVAPVEELEVQAYLWVPCLEPGAHGAADTGPAAENCGYRRVVMDRCGSFCSLADFERLVEDQIALTGPWDELCAAVESPETEQVFWQTRALVPLGLLLLAGFVWLGCFGAPLCCCSWLPRRESARRRSPTVPSYGSV